MTENTAASKNCKRSVPDSEAPEGKKLKEISSAIGEVAVPFEDKRSPAALEEVVSPKEEKESPSGQEVIVPLNDEDDDEFGQIQKYYFEALENMGNGLDLPTNSVLASDPSRAIDLIQVTINEADRLLREHYETSPKLFDGEFYLVLGSSLFFLGQITNRGLAEEEEFVDAAISRLTSALELCSLEIVIETKLALCKALYHKAGLMMQSACQASEEKQQSILDSASIILDNTGVYMKSIFAALFSYNRSPTGKFIDPTQESMYVLGHAQLLADREAGWVSCKYRNNWCQKLYRMALDCKDASVQLNANLGVAACYISLSNYYFDNAPQDDSDSEEEEPNLLSEVNPSVVKDYLTKACEHLSVAIAALGDSPVEIKARAYQMQGEACLNLGNLTTDEAEESKCYHAAVKAFQTAKVLQPDDLLPDSFESFLEEWADNI